VGRPSGKTSPRSGGAPLRGTSWLTIVALEAGGVGSDPRVLHDSLRTMPKGQHNPTPEERNERVKIDLPPDKAIKAILATGPHPEDEPDEE
jgi:hypothetical protein